MDFCEGIVFGHPEYFSSFSSLFICFFGLLGLYNCPKQNLFGQLTFALTVVTGVGSFGYHWTGDLDGWRYFDGNPMYMAGAMAALFTVDEVIRVYTSKTDISSPVAAERAASLTSVNAIFWSAFSVSALWMDTQPRFQAISQLTFAIPVTITVFAIVFARYVTHKKMLTDDWKILSYAKIGLALIVVSATTWVVTESYCEAYPWVAYLHGHVIWHIGMSWGLYLALQFVVWFAAHRYGCRPYFKRGPRWMMILTPIVKYDLNPVIVPMLDPNASEDKYRDDVRQLLSTVPSFSPLLPAELEQLSKTAKRHIRLEGEVIIQKGDKGESMFVVAAGQTEISDLGSDGASLTLSRGALLGEMSLLTGQLRSATVKTLTSTVLYEIHKNALITLLKERPSLIGELSALLSHRTCGSQAQFDHFKKLIIENC